MKTKHLSKTKCVNFSITRIIEESKPPWQAQVLYIVSRSTVHKKILCIDYSQILNRYTLLDAYPWPNNEDTVSRISRYCIFSATVLKSTYYQVPILPEEKAYTAFEANGKHYQFHRILFGITNSVSSFERTIDWVIIEENLYEAFVYLDDIIICGKTLEEHNENLQGFLKAAENPFKKGKCEFIFLIT